MAHEHLKALHDLLPVSKLAPRRLREQVQHPRRVDVPRETVQHTRALGICEAGRVGHVKEQLDARRRFLNVLATRAAAPREAEAQL